jgi:prevent-host-death family protein
MINVHEAKTKLSAVLAQIEATGQSVLICRNGKPVAELGPLKKRSGGRLGKHPVMGKIKIAYDPTEAMTEAEWGTVE